MVHVCPRDSPRGMRQLLYRGLVTTTQVSFYVALKECATSQSRISACLSTTYERLLGFSSIKLSYYSNRSLDRLSLLPLTWRIASVPIFMRTAASRRSKGPSLWFLPFKTVGAAQSGGLKIQRADRRARPQPDRRVRRGQRPLALQSV